MPTMTNLSRLMSLQYVHGGSLRCIPHGVGESFAALEKVGLVAIEVETGEFTGLPLIQHDVTITVDGLRVVEAGMNAMLREVESGQEPR